MSTKNNVSYLLANKCRDYCRVKRLHHIYKYGINSSSRILLRAPYAPLRKFERKQWKDSKGNLHTGLIFVRKKASNDKQLRGSYSTIFFRKQRISECFTVVMVHVQALLTCFRA